MWGCFIYRYFGDTWHSCRFCWNALHFYTYCGDCSLSYRYCWGALHFYKYCRDASCTCIYFGDASHYYSYEFVGARYARWNPALLSPLSFQSPTYPTPTQGGQSRFAGGGWMSALPSRFPTYPAPTRGRQTCCVGGGWLCHYPLLSPRGGQTRSTWILQLL